MAVSPEDIRIPAELLPGRRPLRRRPVEGAPGAGRRARLACGSRYLGTSHRQKTVKSQVGRLRAGLRRPVLAARRLRGRARQRRLDRVLGRRHLRPDPRPRAVPVVRRVRRQVRQRRQEGPVPRRPDHPQGRPRLARRSFAAEAGVDAYCSPHNETSTGVAVDAAARRPAPTPTRWSSSTPPRGAGGLAVDAAEFDVYYFAPQKSFGSDGGLWFALMSPAAIERAARDQGSPAAGSPTFLDLQTAIDNSRLDQTYNTPALATILLMAEQVDWFNANGGLDWCVARTAESSGAPVRLGRGQRRRDAVRRRPGAALAGRRHDRLRRRDRRRRRRQDAARQRDRRHRAVPQARPQPAARRDVPRGRPGRRARADRAASTT